jgi:alpha-1,6-mannosyltransferase
MSQRASEARPKRRWPRYPWTIIFIIAEVFCVGWMSRHGDFLRRGEASYFTLLGLAAGFAYWLAVRRFSRVPLTIAPKRWLFWGVAVALRMAILPVTPGDDLWRYRWEGRIQLHGFNPYLLAPDSPVLAGLRDDEWPLINHRDHAAIYPPLAEMIFAGLAAGGLPVLGYKLLFGLADLGSIAILRRLLARSGASPDAAIWYAWNPLAVYVSAGAAHFDSLMVLALLGAILWLERFRSTIASRNTSAWHFSGTAGASALLLGVAAAIKIVPAVLLPVWAFALGWRRTLVTLPLFAAAVLLPAFYFGFPRVPVFSGLHGFALGFRVNDAAWWVFDVLRRTNPAAQVTGREAVSALFACAALAVWFRQDWRRGVLWVLSAAVILSPVLHAWYLVWLLPLAAWRGPAARSWFVLSISIFGYFLLWSVNDVPYTPWAEPLWLRLFIYLPPIVALAWRQGRSSGAGASEGETW